MKLQYRYIKAVPSVRLAELMDILNNNKEGEVYEYRTIDLKYKNFSRKVDVITNYEKLENVLIVKDGIVDYEVKVEGRYPIVLKQKNLPNIYFIDGVFADKDKELLNISQLRTKPFLYSSLKSEDYELINTNMDITYVIDLSDPTVNLNDYKFIFEDLVEGRISKIYNYTDCGYVKKYISYNKFEIEFEDESIESDFIVDYAGGLYVLTNNNLYIFDAKNEK